VLLQQPLQVVTTTMIMTVDRLQLQLLVQLQLQVQPQVDRRQQQHQRLQARLEVSRLTSLVFFSYHKTSSV
jgi:hypothetical protein